MPPLQAEEEVESVLSKHSISNRKSTRVNDLNPQVKVEAVLLLLQFYIRTAG